ncbi:MAG: dTMP kinase [Nitrospirae bacterium CG_4_10_14_0_8_um_filter_41_23]|nr:dTMP kinase [Nitrospirota bacterium]OIP60693.1 MAG: dTMP kinase [Nitrospirae bacterium CG2_30_41_42]PIQ94228.1 MAG: dTMP kinase [Nitrospirae bacterium CG11_big_fil_rev_8_21_14_0_20_41_14]PIV42607.1 MAG: dTMP kinase [Nitrospirae bacterium CG02_land_8_20_14_3_00_41_53]PIW87174.1 MAG: dTMP kinase [Nitrospirae bacterium CG_4_8_14_3_um_filter_41_47]PIY86384.1 MAG: dTMP kinase [Nitrospirae bacterium CG_4_10_14_0_8_um_filter_41_23]PJA79513.1 MAG: dTMP kinase [Nitrospirae bacterium CG_4_9_14_3_um_
MKGIFISFEGIEGAGKTIQSKLLCEYLLKKGYKVILTEEPGGTRIGLKIRELLLSVENKGMTPVTELLLYNASRAQHIKEVILPALKRGFVVITDRFVDSTVAYQGYGRGIDLSLIYSIEKVVTGGVKPDITILFDIDAEIGLKRNRGIKKSDRLELEDVGFHKRVRSGYLEIVSKEPERIKLIDASEGIEEIHSKIVSIVMDFIN